MFSHHHFATVIVELTQINSVTQKQIISTIVKVQTLSQNYEIVMLFALTVKVPEDKKYFFGRIGIVSIISPYKVDLTAYSIAAWNFYIAVGDRFVLFVAKV